MVQERISASSLVLIVACATALGCEQQKIEITPGEGDGCWGRATSEKLVPVSQMKEVLAGTKRLTLRNCNDPPDLRFFLNDARVAYAVMWRGRAGEPLSIHFHGKNLPRDRWDEGERWCDRFCKLEEVTCVTRVTGDGKVLFDPVWNDRTPPMGH